MKFIAVTEDEPAVQLLNVLFEIVFAEPAPPSVLLKPVMEVAPVTVIFEKLLF